MSNDKKEPWRDITKSVLMAHSGFGEMGRAAVETAAEKAYDLGAHHGRKEALESGESWAKFRADMGPGVGPAWQVSEIDPRGNGVRLVLWGTDVSVSYERGLRQLLNQSLPVDVTAYPAAPSRPVVDAARAEGFAAGLTRARDLLATHADESEALARGQAHEAEQAQTRAAASATRAAVQRGGVVLLDREIAALKGGA